MSPCCLGNAALHPNQGLVGQTLCLDSVSETKLSGKRLCSAGYEHQGIMKPGEPQALVCLKKKYSEELNFWSNKINLKQICFLLFGSGI